jgi:hypothetical protein
MIALHTREVRALGDLDAYARQQLDVIFAGLLAELRKNAASARGKRKKQSD